MKSAKHAAALSTLGLPHDCDLGTSQRLQRDRIVIGEARPTRRFVVVVDGVLDVSREGERLGSVGAGDWCGEIGLLSRLQTGDGRATATVRTRSDVEVISFAPWEFKLMLDAYPDVAGRLRETARSRTESTSCEL